MPIQSFNVKSQPTIKDLCIDPQIKKVMNLKYVVEAMIPVEEWNEPIEQIKKKHSRSPVLVIDYLRKLRTKTKSQDERLRIEEIVGQLTNLAKTWNIPIIAISELARDSYKLGQKLSMGSFKETGMIEYEASWLGILAPVEETDGGYQLKQDWENIIHHDGTIDLIVFKAKRGTGFTGKIPLRVDKEYMVVTDRLAIKTNKKTSIFGQE
jgi:replicative DNA helicase